MSIKLEGKKFSEFVAGLTKVTDNSGVGLPGVKDGDTVSLDGGMLAKESLVDLLDEEVSYCKSFIDGGYYKKSKGDNSWFEAQNCWVSVVDISSVSKQGEVSASFYCADASGVEVGVSLYKIDGTVFAVDIPATFDSNGMLNFSYAVSSSITITSVRFRIKQSGQRCKNWMYYLVEYVDSIIDEINSMDNSRIEGGVNITEDTSVDYSNGHVGNADKIGSAIPVYPNTNRKYATLPIVNGKGVKFYHEESNTTNMIQSTVKFVVTNGSVTGAAIELYVATLGTSKNSPLVVENNEDEHYMILSFDKILADYPTATNVWVNFDKDVDYYVNYVHNLPKKLDWLVNETEVNDTDDKSFGIYNSNLRWFNYAEANFADKFYNMSSSNSARLRACFSTATDIHEDFDSLKYIARMDNKYPFIKDTNFAITLTGDLLTGSSTYPKATSKQKIKQFTDIVTEYGLKVLPCIGDHDFGNGNAGITLDNSQRNHIDYCLTKSEQRSLIINPCLTIFGDKIVISSDSSVCYYYAKDTANKIIFVMTDEFDTPEEKLPNTNYYKYDRYECTEYSYNQLVWLKNLLLSVEDGWSVCVFNHSGKNKFGKDETTTIGSNTFIKKNDLGGTITSAYQMLSSYKNRQSFTIAQNEFVTSDISCDFTNAKGSLIGLFCGHVHGNDYNSNRFGFNIIASPNIGDYPYSGSNKRTYDSPLSICSDYFVCDVTERKVMALRYGRRISSINNTNGVLPNESGDRFIDGSVSF